MQLSHVFIVENSPIMIKALRVVIKPFTSSITAASNMNDLVCPQSYHDCLLIYNHDIVSDFHSTPQDMARICLCSADKNVMKVSNEYILQKPLSAAKFQQALNVLGFSKQNNAKHIVSSTPQNNADNKDKNTLTAEDVATFLRPEIKHLIANELSNKVQKYCELNFKSIAEKVLQLELQKLADKSTKSIIFDND